MKYITALAAALFLPAIPAASAQAYGCSELSGGTYTQTCETSSGAATRIIRVERQARGHPASAGQYTSSAYVDSYTSSQVSRHPGAYAHDASPYSYSQAYPVRHADGAATSYGFEWWASDRYYGRDYYPTTAYTAHQPVRHGSDVTVYRGSGTYTGCGATTYRSDRRVTTYSAPTSYPVPAGSYDYAYEDEYAYADEPGYGYETDYAPVVARSSGYCQQDITKLRDDRQGRARYEVCFRDLTPVGGERVEVLYSRIERAADEACDVNRSSIAPWASQRCEAGAIDRAVYDTGLEALASYHRVRTGRATPRVRVGPLQRY
jgi:hypothetical protein